MTNIFKSFSQDLGTDDSGLEIKQKMLVIFKAIIDKLEEKVSELKKDLETKMIKSQGTDYGMITVSKKPGKWFSDEELLKKKFPDKVITETIEYLDPDFLKGRLEDAKKAQKNNEPLPEGISYVEGTGITLSVKPSTGKSLFELIAELNTVKNKLPDIIKDFLQLK